MGGGPRRAPLRRAVPGLLRPVGVGARPGYAESMSPRYVVRLLDPAAHLFQVELQLDQPAPDGQLLSLPAWIPGSYMIREFSKHIVRLRALGPAGELAVCKLDKRRWQVAPSGGPLRVLIEVYAYDLSVRKAFLDTSRGYFNGTSLFLCPEGFAHLPAEVEILEPTDPACAGWRVATSLPRIAGEPWGFGRFRAADYDELIDHPVELGPFELHEFTAAGRPHHLVISGRHGGDAARLVADLRTICQWHCDFWGVVPMERYLFQLNLVGDGYGGLEHRASTSLISKREDMPPPGRTELTDGYRGLLGLCSHEYFHTWNVKRLKPAAFWPYDLSKESPTTLLWAFEGITSYYDDLALLRSGLIGVDSYFELLGRTMTRVFRAPGRFVQSLADSSLDTWIKLYQPDENSNNATISYYTKGALAALALDLHLRLRTQGACSLDRLMRALWERYAAQGRGVPEDGVEALAAELSGLDLRAFFDLVIRGTDELPLAELLQAHGVKLRLRPAESAEDKGGKPGKEAPGGDLGADLAGSAGAVKLKSCRTGGPAMRAGLSAGDVVVAADGLRATPAGLRARFAQARPGERIELLAFREDVLVRAVVEVQAPPADTAWLELDPEADEAAVARRTAWLEGR